MASHVKRRVRRMLVSLKLSTVTSVTSDLNNWSDAEHWWCCLFELTDNRETLGSRGDAS